MRKVLLILVAFIATVYADMGAKMPPMKKGIKMWDDASYVLQN